jgi:flagellar hook-length control protein FliK
MDQPALNNVFPLVTPVQRGPAAPSSRGRQPGESSDDTRFRDALDQQRSTPTPPKRREPPPTESKSASKADSTSSPPSSPPAETSSSKSASEPDDASVNKSTPAAPPIKAETSQETSPSSDQDVGDESADLLAPIEQSLVALAAVVPEATPVDVSDQSTKASSGAPESIPAPKGLTDSLHASLPKETAIITLTRVADANEENSDAPQSAPPGLAQAISAVSKVQTNEKPVRKAPVATQQSLLAEVPATEAVDTAPVEPTETSIDRTQSLTTGVNGPVDQQNPTIVDELPADVASEPSENAAPVSDEISTVADEAAPRMSSLQSTHHQTANLQATESRRDQPTAQPIIEDVAPPAPVVEDASAEESSDEGSSTDTTAEIDRRKVEIDSASQRDDQAAQQPVSSDRRDVVPPATPDARTDRSERRTESRSSREPTVTTTKGVAEPNLFASRNSDRAIAQTVDTTTGSNEPVVTEQAAPVAVEQLPSADLQNPEFLQALDAIATTRMASASGDVQEAAMPPAIRQVQSSWPQPIVGNEELVFDLTPPELGRIRIELRHGESGLVASFETETPAARQLITEHIPALRESLQQQGAVMERVEVRGRDDGSAFGQFSQSSGEQTRDQRQQPENAYVPESAADEPTPQQPRSEATPARRRDGSALNIRV